MRYLTIRREKSFVGCLMKSKVYIEDPYYGDTTIGGVRCRKLGDLKNGTEVTFTIGDEAARVYVICDKMSRNYCNDFFLVPAGNFNVLLVGKHEMNPATGNAFRFYGNDHPEAVENRKRGSRVGLTVLIVAIVIGFLVGLLSGIMGAMDEEAQPKTFTTGDITITLTDEFEEGTLDGYDAVWESWDMMVVVLQEPFDTLTEVMEDPATATVREFAELHRDSNEKTAPIETRNGLTRYCYEWENEENGVTYRYYTYLFKSDDSFWMVQFFLDAEDAAEYQDLIPQWAQSVTFAPASTGVYA